MAEGGSLQKRRSFFVVVVVVVHLASKCGEAHFSPTKRIKNVNASSAS